MLQLKWRRKIIRELTLPKSIFRDIWLRDLIGYTDPFFVDFRGMLPSAKQKLGGSISTSSGFCY